MGRDRCPSAKRRMGALGVVKADPVADACTRGPLIGSGKTTGDPMASKTTLNAKNLEVLGAERLAQLLIEVSTGNAAAKRCRRDLGHSDCVMNSKLRL